MTLTLELALTMAALMTVGGGLLWWQAVAFDRKYGRSYGAGAKKIEPSS